MAQPRFPEDQPRHSCVGCQVVAGYTSLGHPEAAQAAASTLGGHFSPGAFYCPACSVQLGLAEISTAAADVPPLASSELAQEIEPDLPPHVTSDFADATWDHLEELASAEPGTEHATAAAKGLPAAAGGPALAQRVTQLLKEMHNLDLELGENYQLSWELEMCLRNCREELADLLDC